MRAWTICDWESPRWSPTSPCWSYSRWAAHGCCGGKARSPTSTGLRRLGQASAPWRCSCTPALEPPTRCGWLCRLTLLASYGIAQLMVDRRVVLLWDSEGNEAQPAPVAESGLYTTAYWWVKWLIAGIVLPLLLVISVQFLEAARLMLSLPEYALVGDMLSQLGGQPPFAACAGHDDAVVHRACRGLSAAGELLGRGDNPSRHRTGILWLHGLVRRGRRLGNIRGRARQPRTASGGSKPSAAMSSCCGTPCMSCRSGAAMDSQRCRSPSSRIAPAASRATDWLPGCCATFPTQASRPHPAQAEGQPFVLTADDAAQYNQLGGDYVGQRFLLRRGWSVSQQSLWGLARLVVAEPPPRQG